MSKVSVYANEEARLIEFIADDWRFSLWLDEPMSYSFVCTPTQKNIMVGEELPEKVINVLRSLLTCNLKKKDKSIHDFVGATV